ncbi:MAG: Crp/Fnr family transcriptional regulator, partial [Maribacter sp.]|nr:Crp/Fnr family transcriptional regulator [Maribacter sp.]
MYFSVMKAATLIKHFETYLPFEEAEIALIESRISRRNVKRRENILQAGKVCQYYTFVVSG